MKNTWPYGIMALFFGFVGLMVTMAVIASKNKGSLVVKNYYQAEVQFQQQIDKEENANALAVKPTITFDKNTRAVEVFFPQAIYADGVEGKLLFYRANAPEMDMEIPVKLDADGKQIIPADKLKNGRWKVQLNWETNGLQYYTEQVINI
ncbi:MAG: FixH family protein [Bacteroidia bacterium]